MTPNWQPVEALPFIAGMLDDQLQTARQQVGNLEQCRHRPDVLDSATVSRLQAVFGEQIDLLPVFREQLVRWLELSLDEHQRLEMGIRIFRWTAQICAALQHSERRSFPLSQAPPTRRQC